MPVSEVPWNELQTKVAYSAYASYFTKHYGDITQNMDVTVTLEFKQKGSSSVPYQFKFTPAASSTNATRAGPLLELLLILHSAFGAGEWSYFNKFCLRVKSVVDSIIRSKETEALENALRQQKLKQQEADALAAIHSNVFNNSLTMDDPFDTAGGSDVSGDERTMITAVDNGSRKQRRGSCEPQSSGSRKQESGSAGKRRREESSDSGLPSGSESSGSESRKKKKRKAPKTSFAAQAFGAAASMFGVKKE